MNESFNVSIPYLQIVSKILKMGSSSIGGLTKQTINASSPVNEQDSLVNCKYDTFKKCLIYKESILIHFLCCFSSPKWSIRIRDSKFGLALVIESSRQVTSQSFLSPELLTVGQRPDVISHICLVSHIFHIYV